MARYNGLIIPRSYNDYYSRSDPQAIRDIVSLAADEELNAESKNPLQNQAIAKIVPATASPDNKLIVQSQISGLTADVETIKNIIPNTASETNELADKNFVNSTVGTNTANYIYKTESGGEKVPFSSVAELEAYAGTVTNNDYAFVTGIDENGNAYYDRYKADVNDGVVTWAKEYRLNNSSFTAEQWAAIQSGITAEKVAQFEGAVAPVDVVQSGNMSAVTSNAVNNALNNYQPLKRKYINPGNNDWGITVNQILSTSDLITLLENKGFLATKSDPSYKNCTVSFRYYLNAPVFLQINSSIKVNLISATINCESQYGGDSNWLGFRKILIIGRDFLATYTMGGWSYYTRDNNS